MNERIKILLEQSRTKDYWSEGYYLVDFVNQEKFAKLIVKECMKEVRDESQHAYNYKFADVVTERVFKHFGVEE